MPPRKSRSKKGKRRKLTYLVAWLAVVLLTLASAIVFWGYDWWKGLRAKKARYAAFGIHVPDQYAIHGIDVSRYQGTIAWEEVKAMKVGHIRIQFAFIKATEGISGVDKQFYRNWKRAKQNEMTRGAYHFFLATKDGRQQAENFIKTVDLEQGDLPPVVDIEQLYGVNAATMKKELKEWLDIVETHYKVRPIIYTNVDFYKRNLGKDFDSYPLWAAHYLTYDRPSISRIWSFWQHSEEGRVNGILSKVDFNVFSGDSTEFQQLLLK